MAKMPHITPAAPTHRGPIGTKMTTKTMPTFSAGPKRKGFD